MIYDESERIRMVFVNDVYQIKKVNPNSSVKIYVILLEFKRYIHLFHPSCIIVNHRNDLQKKRRWW